MNETERRRFLRAALAGAGLTLASAGAGTTAGAGATARQETTTEEQETTTEEDETTTSDGETTTTDDTPENGLVTVESNESVDATVERIEEDIDDEDPLSLVTTIDHARNAESAGFDLRPTTLIIFGNPNLGTPLMQASRTAAIDLPQKLLVWEAADGRVNVTYNDPQWLAERHSIEGQDEVLEQISGALESLAQG